VKYKRKCIRITLFYRKVWTGRINELFKRKTGTTTDSMAFIIVVNIETRGRQIGAYNDCGKWFHTKTLKAI